MEQTNLDLTPGVTPLNAPAPKKVKKKSKKILSKSSHPKFKIKERKSPHWILVNQKNGEHVYEIESFSALTNSKFNINPFFKTRHDARIIKALLENQFPSKKYSVRKMRAA